ncbi:MAG: penicillin-binding protein 2 [Candidatus Omnitrophica bacterium]|nr:penicillin-binding protein 2 [Candidatus Omnitrophota bacterium]
MRNKIIRIVIVIFFGVIVVDLIYIQAIKGEFYHRLSTNNRIRIVPLEGWRGKIMDRHDSVLADNRLAYDVLVTPQEVKDINAMVKFLSSVIDVSETNLIRNYTSRKFTPFAPVTIAEDVSRDQAFRIEENKFRFPGMFVQETFKRTYPDGLYQAHILGYVSKISRAKREKYKEYGYTPQSLIGYSGIEEYYDTYLQGQQGGLQIEVNSRGQQVQLLSLKEPTKGLDVVLTIDKELQKISHDLMAGQNGVILVMDMDSGEILGMTSSPAYDPNIFVNPNISYQLNDVFQDKQSPILNRAIKATYPPGSVFKVLLALAGLDSKKITPYTPFICEGFLELGGIRFGCTHQHGSQNLTESLAHSCNIYYYRLGQILGVETIYTYAKKFGLGQVTHIDLPYEKEGLIPNKRIKRIMRKEPWYTGDTLNMSIGQGDVLTTPLQLVRLLSIVGNSGLDVQPHLIKKIGEQEVLRYQYPKRIHIPESTFSHVQRGLRATVSDYSGTAHVLDIPQIYVAGKTGTAQTFGGREDHAWFVGYAKTDKRNISFCVFLEHGGSSHNACLVARQLLLRLKSADII